MPDVFWEKNTINYPEIINHFVVLIHAQAQVVQLCASPEKKKGDANRKLWRVFFLSWASE